MAEKYPADATLNALSGTTDSEQEVAYPTIFESPYYTTFYKMLYRLLDVARRAGDLRVYKDGDMTYGVRAGKFFDGDTLRTYAGSTGNAVTAGNTYYIYLTAAGTLTSSTSSFPTPSTTPHIRLATIELDAGETDYDHSDITDMRATAFLTLSSGLTGADMAEAAAFFQNTDITGAEAESLSDGSTDGGTLHKHTVGALDGLNSSFTQIDNLCYNVSTATGTLLDDLCDGSSASTMHTHGLADIEPETALRIALPVGKWTRSSANTLLAASAAADTGYFDGADDDGSGTDYTSFGASVRLPGQWTVRSELQGNRADNETHYDTGRFDVTLPDWFDGDNHTVTFKCKWYWEKTSGADPTDVQFDMEAYAIDYSDGTMGTTDLAQGAAANPAVPAEDAQQDFSSEIKTDQSGEELSAGSHLCINVMATCTTEATSQARMVVTEPYLEITKSA